MQVLIYGARINRSIVLIRIGTAGIAELMIFHPVDTTAKRLMSNQGKVRMFTPCLMDYN